MLPIQILHFQTDTGLWLTLYPSKKKNIYQMKLIHQHAFRSCSRTNSLQKILAPPTVYQGTYTSCFELPTSSLGAHCQRKEHYTAAWPTTKDSLFQSLVLKAVHIRKGRKFQTWTKYIRQFISNITKWHDKIISL